ncbi:hypothetical protein GCM10010460_32080 [Microbacterium terrae]|uniref:Uncharacterized protein n=2 Tax=Microbacterium terrae TaxID=69369 RepID=A0A0M2GWL8_9MICO|nr:hypothetical protein RS81_03137 [Microbacterium terrae]GLJ99157.1 hypothetical protein GCM10017594_23540 [Microbacterium terrae]
MLPLVALIAVGAALSACTATAPEPTETALFSDEDEAFAAAEATYRAYVDALNAVDLSDPDTFEDVYAWTTGDLNASDRKGLSAYHADGVVVAGDSVITILEPFDISDSLDAVQLAACVDISDVNVFDSEGDSLVDADRPDFQQTTVTLEESTNSETGLLVASISPRTDGTKCG